MILTKELSKFIFIQTREITLRECLLVGKAEKPQAKVANSTTLTIREAVQMEMSI
jgi:hypothetical protein